MNVSLIFKGMSWHILLRLILDYKRELNKKFVSNLQIMPSNLFDVTVDIRRQAINIFKLILNSIDCPFAFVL